MRTTRPGTLLAVGLGVLVVITVLLFTVPLPTGVELVLDGAWVVLVVVLCWGTAWFIRSRQRAGLERVEPDGAAESPVHDEFDRATLTGQDRQLPHPPAR